MNDNSERTILEFARASTIEGWWWWALLVVSLSAVLYACVRFYRRDTHELSHPVRLTLIFLRLVTIAGLIFFFFDFQRRTQREISRASEVVVLVDTSQSMSLSESDEIGSLSRADRVVSLLGDSELTDRLSSEHRLSVYRFGDSSEPMLLETRGGRAVNNDDAGDGETPMNRLSTTAVLGVGLVILALALSILSLAIGGASASKSQSEKPNLGLGWLLAGTACLLVFGLVLSGSVYSYQTTRSFTSLIGLSTGTAESQEIEEEAAESEPSEETIRVLNWEEAIAASAAQSRIGDALASVLAAHDPTTLAGVVVLTDGQNNGGQKRFLRHGNGASKRSRGLPGRAWQQSTAGECSRRGPGCSSACVSERQVRDLRGFAGDRRLGSRSVGSVTRRVGCFGDRRRGPFGATHGSHRFQDNSHSR